MPKPFRAYGFYTILFLLMSIYASAQQIRSVTGTIKEASGKAVAGAVVHVQGTAISVVSKSDGSFHLSVSQLYDSLQITGTGYETKYISLKSSTGGDLEIILTAKVTGLDAVVLTVSKKAEKKFMQKVIEHKSENYFPGNSGGYTKYIKKELDLDNVNFSKTGWGISRPFKNAYLRTDSNALTDKELPLYFSEVLTAVKGGTAGAAAAEQVIAKKTLGLQTDELLERLGKFYFHFNIYDDWLPVFDKTYVSPLNSNAFKYYNFFEGDSSVENGIRYLQVRFAPVRPYENTFTGSLWINVSNYAVQYVNMHLSKTADLNFVSDINYTEEFTPDTTLNGAGLMYIPFKYTSETGFESSTSLIGIPSQKEKKGLKFLIKNTTILTYLNGGDTAQFPVSDTKHILFPNTDESFWQSRRPEQLSAHEKNIYRVTDSLKKDPGFKRNIRLLALAGTGYWDFGKTLRIGPYTSLISTNKIEGIRTRIGFLTMSGLSKKVSLFGYGAFGTADKTVKGMLGIKYIWNEKKWTKTTFSLGRDYNFIIDPDDAPDQDNSLNSLLRKNIPYSLLIYSRQLLLKHEQYVSKNLTATASLNYKEITPIFYFAYKTRTPNIFSGTLPATEFSAGLRYAKNERTKILNYDKLRLETYSPVLTLKYSTGLVKDNSQFRYYRLYAAAEQQLRLPPGFMLYYKAEAGKITGTAPYLLLNVPVGNEYYVAGKSLFNTMLPYEFAADRYAALHSRFYFNGYLLKHIPFIKKLGWRERISFNAYSGGMSASNKTYNSNSRFTVPSGSPFMEAGGGIENIFHVLSIEYYRRLSYNNAVVKKGGLYLGFTLSF